MDKKNIDEIFQEKLKTFREVPDEKVWVDIENSLDKKRKRRVIPFWWSLGGVAAVLAIALIAFYTSSGNNYVNTTITNTENSNTKEAEQIQPDTIIEKNQKNALQINEISEDAIAKGAGDKNLKNTEKYNKNEADVAPETENVAGTSRNNSEKLTSPIQEIDEEALVNSDKDVQNGNNDKSPEIKNDTAVLPRTPSDADVATTSEQDSIKTDADGSKKLHSQSPSETQLAENTAEKNSNDSKPNLNRKDNKSTPSYKNINTSSEEGNSKVAAADFDASRNANISKAAVEKNLPNRIANNREKPNVGLEVPSQTIAQKDEIIKNDQINDTIATDKKISILEALEPQIEEEEIAESSSSRWSAGPNVAPVYFDAIGEGSPIDPGFAPNAKSGGTNMSYGVSIAYAVSKKLSVRSGIHKTEYGYNTDNVGFSPTLAASVNGNLQNIEFSGSADNLALNSADTATDAPENFNSDISSLNTARDGTVLQQFGYLEVPLELDYALLNNRFGINLLGGFSSLFLINNSVTLNSDELTAEIGEARNLNDVNFSTNVGFGINYKFTSQIQLNIEPVFKYQLNTFSNVSGDFRPYSIGVYSGLNFKF